MNLGTPYYKAVIYWSHLDFDTEANGSYEIDYVHEDNIETYLTVLPLLEQSVEIIKKQYPGFIGWEEIYEYLDAIEEDLLNGGLTEEDIEKIRFFGDNHYNDVYGWTIHNIAVYKVQNVTLK